MNIEEFCFKGDRKFVIKSANTNPFGEIDSKEEAENKRQAYLARMQQLQDKLYAEKKEALLIIFQAMDAAGKDGAIKHVLSGMNPQGIDVRNFKVPSSEEAEHDYLWRAMRVMPERGRIAIFNRSYYEDVLIDKVHNLYKTSNLPDRCKTVKIYDERYQQINNYEKYLYQNGIRVVKLFLHISKDGQKKQFLERIDDDTKNWKFSDDDIIERDYWENYQVAYSDAVNATATLHSPWYVVPSDKRWFSRLAISEIIIKTLEEINPKYPTVTKERKTDLLKFRQKLMDG